MKIRVFRVFIIFSVTSLIGLLLASNLPLKYEPTSSLSTIIVSYNCPNTSPINIERQITSKLEAGISVIRGIKKITSRSFSGRGVIRVTVDETPNLKRLEIATITKQLYKQFPNETSFPKIELNNPNESSSKAFLTYSVIASHPYFDIQEIFRNKIKPVLGGIDGVSRIELSSIYKKEYVLDYNYNTLLQLKISKSDILLALNNMFHSETIGHIENSNSKIAISLNPLITKHQIDWHYPIKKVGTKFIYLDEILGIEKIEQKPQNYKRINGKNSIEFNLYAEEDANTVKLANEINSGILGFKKEIPTNYSIIKKHDSTKKLKVELNKILQRTIYTIVILFILVFLISRSIKYLFIIFISLVVNISTAFIFYYFFNVQIHLYSLAGITISFGIIIDNSIVVINHIIKNKSNKIFIPLLASTITTISSLIIVYFLQEHHKMNLIDFAFAIIINLSISMLVALILVPALIQVIILPKREEALWQKKLKHRFYFIYENLIVYQLKIKKLLVLSLILLFGVPIFLLPKKVEDNDKWYGKVYNKTLGSDTYNINFRPFLEKYLGGTSRLFYTHALNKFVDIKSDDTKLHVLASMQKGATIEQMNLIFIDIESFILQFDEIEKFETNISSINHGNIELTFKEKYIETTFPIKFQQAITKKISNYGGIDWSIYGVGKGFRNSIDDNTQPISYSVEARGYNYEELNKWVDSLTDKLSIHPRVNNIKVNETYSKLKKSAERYSFLIDKERLSIENKKMFDLTKELQQLTLSKKPELSMKIGGNYLPIRLESKQSTKYDLWNIQNSPIDSLDSATFLKNIIKISKEREEEVIFKENQEFLKVISFGYSGVQKFGTEFLKSKLANLESELPLGYTFKRKEFAQYQNQFNAQYLYLIFLVLLIIYIVCAILFESLTQPLIIISIIPIAFIGCFLTFYMFDLSFNQGGLMSFILLCGITVNATIYIINNYNVLIKTTPNSNSLEIYLESFKQVIFPIMMTIISTIFGFLAFVKDGSNEVFWFTIGIGVIGGLIFSIIGIMIYLPLFVLRKSSVQ